MMASLEVGSSRPVPPNHLTSEDPNNLERWSPEVRASVIDFELHSRLGFRAISGTDVAELWHAELGAATSPALPGVTYQPLVTMERPSEDKLLEQLSFVASYADLRQDRMSEILAQLPGPMAFMSFCRLSSSGSHALDHRADQCGFEVGGFRRNAFQARSCLQTSDRILAADSADDPDAPATARCRAGMQPRRSSRLWSSGNCCEHPAPCPTAAPSGVSNLCALPHGSPLIAP